MMHRSDIKKVSIIREFMPSGKRVKSKSRSDLIRQFLIYLEVENIAAVCELIRVNFAVPNVTQSILIGNARNKCITHIHVTGTIEDRVIFAFESERGGSVVSLGLPLGDLLHDVKFGNYILDGTKP